MQIALSVLKDIASNQHTLVGGVYNSGIFRRMLIHQPRHHLIAFSFNYTPAERQTIDFHENVINCRYLFRCCETSFISIDFMSSMSTITVIFLDLQLY